MDEDDIENLLDNNANTVLKKIKKYEGLDLVNILNSEQAKRKRKSVIIELKKMIGV